MILNLISKIIFKLGSRKKPKVLEVEVIQPQIAVAAPLLETGLIINSFKSFSAHF